MTWKFLVFGRLCCVVILATGFGAMLGCGSKAETTKRPVAASDEIFADDMPLTVEKPDGPVAEELKAIDGKWLIQTNTDTTRYEFNAEMGTFKNVRETPRRTYIAEGRFWAKDGKIYIKTDKLKAPGMDITLNLRLQIRDEIAKPMVVKVKPTKDGIMFEVEQPNKTRFALKRDNGSR